MAVDSILVAVDSTIEGVESPLEGVELPLEAVGLGREVGRLKMSCVNGESRPGRATAQVLKGFTVNHGESVLMEPVVATTTPGIIGLILRRSTVKKR